MRLPSILQVCKFRVVELYPQLFALIQYLISDFLIRSSMGPTRPCRDFVQIRMALYLAKLTKVLGHRCIITSGYYIIIYVSFRLKMLPPLPHFSPPSLYKAASSYDSEEYCCPNPPSTNICIRGTRYRVQGSRINGNPVSRYLYHSHATRNPVSSPTSRWSRSNVSVLQVVKLGVQVVPGSFSNLWKTYFLCSAAFCCVKHKRETEQSKM